MNSEVEHSQELRREEREIASVVIISADGKFLLGKKYPEKEGSYVGYWHIMGGGVDPGETLEDAALREVLEESGLVLSAEDLVKIEGVGKGESEKKLPSNERIISVMTFNRFEARLGQNAEDIQIPSQTDEFEELRWFTPEELGGINQIPGGREFFVQQGYISE
ncbi:MAG: NUDIX hydrolase [Candidatus Saccharibacteria bacterium]|nr:NUDIX hydrolase [Candidatus Saccharibacteria bacterium]